MDDIGRTHLVTKFQCYDCGKLLQLSYDKPKKSGVDAYSEGEPTGGNMVNNIITIHPCRCTKEAEQRLQTLKEILGENR